MHRSYDPLHYILLFPFGTDGYHLDLCTSAKKRITPSDFYRHMLQVRQDSDNYLMRSRRLLQQYACDQFAKIEGERLKFIALHQKEIRAYCPISTRDCWTRLTAAMAPVLEDELFCRLRSTAALASMQRSSRTICASFATTGSRRCL